MEEGGGGGGALSSLESVLIKKDWFYVTARGEMGLLQTCSETREGGRRGGGRGEGRSVEGACGYFPSSQLLGKASFIAGDES